MKTLDAHKLRLAILLLITLNTACKAEQTPAAAATGTAHDTAAQRITWTRAAPATSQDLVELIGVVELSSDATHTLAPPLPARIVSWAVKPGQRVAPGDALGELQIPELQDLQSAQSAAAALVKAREGQIKAREAEVNAGVRDLSALREAEVAAREATLALNNVRAQLGARRPTAQLKPAGGARWRWESPVAGVIEQVRCSPGASTTPQDACLVLVEASRSAVRVDVPERLVAQLDAVSGATWQTGGGQPVEVSITRRASALEMSSHTLPVYLTAADPQGLTSAPGSTGRVTLRRATASGAVMVPRTSIIELDGQPHVFVKDSSNKPTALKVSRIAELGESVIISADALKAEAEVVERGTFLLKSMLLLSQEG